MKVTLGPTHLPHAAGSDSRWPGGLRHARGPVHFICFGMFCCGLCTGQQTRKTLRNLNLKVLQGNKYQLGLYGFGTHNAHKRTDWSFQAFLEVACSTMTDPADLLAYARQTADTNNHQALLLFNKTAPATPAPCTNA